jgi:hypothetical protein
LLANIARVCESDSALRVVVQIFVNNPSRAIDLTSRLVRRAWSTAFYLRPDKELDLPIKPHELKHEFTILVVTENMVFSRLFQFG